MRQFGRFRNEVARRRYLTAYDGALGAWPTPPAQLDVGTRYGTTHVLAAGSQNGTPIVLLHPIAVASPSWFPSIAALSGHRRVFAVDTIGDAGRSTQTSRIHDGRDLSSWMVDVLDALALDRAHLVGLSYGGWLALNQAYRSPDRLASVTAVDPPGALGRPRGSFVIRILPDSVLAKFGKSDTALHRLLRLLNNGTLPDQPLLDLSVAGLRMFRAKLPYPKRMTDDALRKIDTPTLLLFCERSPVNNAHRALERSRRLVANVDAEVVPGAGHMLPVEMPELFASRVIRFIDAVDTEGSP